MGVKQATNSAVAIACNLNNLNQITSDGTSSYNSAGNGNFLSISSSSFTYDDENQLASTQVSNSWKTDFIYDGKNRLRKRIEYSWNGLTWQVASETRYIYDGMLVVQERDYNNNPTVTYSRGTDLSGSLQGAGGIGGLLARSHGYTAGSWTTHNFYHADGNGNITYLVNSSQTLAASYKYNPFGGTITSSGTLASANTYRFSSKEYHSNPGLYCFGYRFYDPNLQRWLNTDPLGDESFLERQLPRKPRALRSAFRSFATRGTYSFVQNKPTSFYDGFGLYGKGYDAEECQAILDAIKQLEELTKQAGFDLASIYDQLANLAEEYNENCDDGGNKPKPDPAPAPVCPQPSPKPKEELCPAGTVATVVGITVGGYVVYRCVRMLPSLLPPLWPTIPANIAIP